MKINTIFNTHMLYQHYSFVYTEREISKNQRNASFVSFHILVRLQHMRRAITCACLYTCLKHQILAKKHTPCLIQKALRCAADHTSKTTITFIFHFLYNTKIYKKIMCIYFLFHWFSGENCIIFLFSLQKKQRTSKELKRNMNDGTIVFLTFLLVLT